MIEIDRSKCKKMLVSSNGVEWVERIVLFGCHDNWCVCVKSNYEREFREGEAFDTVSYRHYKPLPEPKPMTALDVLWWSDTVMNGKSIVIEDRRILDKYTLLFDIEFPNEDISDYRWNELIRENGETKLKYEQWKPFTFDECDMGEG